MIEATLSELARELRSAGVPWRLARRAEHEARDHLLSAAEVRGADGAVTAFGSPRVVALRIAEQAATRSTRRAAVLTLAALVCTAAAYLAAAAVSSQAGNPDIASGATPWLGGVAAVALALFPQIAFACGLLVALPLVVRRRASVLSGADLTVIRRRAAVGLAAGAAAMAAWALWLLEFRAQLVEAEPWAVPALTALVLVPLAPLVLALVSVARSARPAARPGAGAATAFEDAVALGAAVVPPLKGLPSLSAPLLAAALAALIGAVAFSVGWVAEGDPVSGAVRGLFEAVAVLVCFAAFARVLVLAGRP